MSRSALAHGWFETDASAFRLIKWANKMNATIANQFPMEVECKYRVEEVDQLRSALDQCGAKFLRTERHRDTYLRHPCRDFRVTDEALRIREIDEGAVVTYKGPRLPGPIKIRPEIELPLVEGTREDWLRIWTSLGFQVAMQVEKTRQVFDLLIDTRMITVTIDEVVSLGTFAEIERVVASAEELANAEADVQAAAAQLGLKNIERHSYLSMVLEKAGER